MGIFPASQSTNGRGERRSPRPSDRSIYGGSVGMGDKLKTTVPIIPGTGSISDEPIDLTILADVPGWLRTLRLHKYTPNFEGARWQDMVLMDDAALERKGVAALGARRKLLKVFENVRIQQRIPVSRPFPLNMASIDSASDLADRTLISSHEASTWKRAKACFTRSYLYTRHESE